MNYKLNQSNILPVNIFDIDIDPVFCDKIEAIVEKDYDTYKKNLKHVRAKTSGWKGLRYPILQDIGDFICSKVLPVIGKNLNWQYNNWKTHESWINVYEKGDSCTPHMHLPVDYCALFIVKPGVGNLRFYKPLTQESVVRGFEPMNCEVINEERSKIILFPPWLYHDVINVHSRRITVAFNFFNDVIPYSQ